MRRGSVRWIIVVIMILLDWYVFQALKTVTQNSSDKIRYIIYGSYWAVSAFSILFLVLMPMLFTNDAYKSFRTYAFAIIVGLFFAKLLIGAFLVIDDLRRFAMWLTSKLFPDTGAHFTENDNLIPRSTFLSWIGLGLGAGLFGSLLYGFSNKYDYRVRRQKLRFPNLPKQFSGLKVVQISDVHSGSLQDKDGVEKGIRMIMDLKPDIIFFTGDLVNDKADEMKELKNVFKQLNAPMGVFSVLGNHDYGDYVEWESATAKKENLQRLIEIQKEMGWNILINEHAVIKNEGAEIAILGIENWSARGRFPKYGKMSEAYQGTEIYPFKILLSHDPSHWEAEVIPKYPDVDLMLSGHTHGMQFGVELPHFRWSPVQYIYKQWAGLYEEGKQKLYVNRGFGFIGYPGRVGILPEITLLELEKG